MDPKFYGLYIKDKAEPIELLAQILATHSFQNTDEQAQFKKWASITKNLWRKAKFDIVEVPIQTAM